MLRTSTAAAIAALIAIACSPPPANTVEQATPAATPAPVATTAEAVAQAEPMPVLPNPETLPPLPAVGFRPPRPLETVHAVYRFAALHPEVLRYVPCFCGCERNGHRDNEDCFVASRGADGAVTWDAHGLG